MFIDIFFIQKFNNNLINKSKKFKFRIFPALTPGPGLP